MSGDAKDGSRWRVACTLIEDRRMGWAMVLGGLLYGLLSWPGWNIFPCPFKTVTTLPCPGCGMTRACQAALRGDWPMVLKMNLFGPFFLLFWVVVGVGLVLPLGARKRYVERLGRVELFTRWPAWVLAGMLLYTLTRWLGVC